MAVVGLGSDIAGDDGVGVVAVRRLRERLRGRPDVVAIELPWAGLHLLTALRGFRRAILIDSLRSGRRPPGTIVELDENALAGSVRLNSFHDLNYPTALALGRLLGWPLPDRIRIFGIEGAAFDRFESRLSPAAAAAVERLVALIVELLAGNGCEEREITGESMNACGVRA